MCGGQRVFWQVVHIAYGEKEYLIDAYNNICDKLEINIGPIFAPDRAGDIKHSNADISKARELLRYKPEIGAYQMP